MDFTTRRDNGNRIIWEQSQIDYIIESYNKDISCRQIAKQFSVRPETISRLLKKNNIKTRSAKEYYIHDYPRDSFFFHTIDSPIKAYWLGFLYADGCLTKNTIQISIQERDKQHLISFKEDIKAVNHKITKTSKSQYFGWHFSIRDKQMAEDLKKNGCIERKSLVLRFPNNQQVPDEYLIDFIRGYFDGDGTLSFDMRNGKPQIRFGFCGTKEFLNTLKEKLELKNSLQKTGNAYTFVVSGNKQGIKFFNKIYNNPCRYLQRKYDLYQSFLKNYCA